MPCMIATKKSTTVATNRRDNTHQQRRPRRQTTEQGHQHKSAQMASKHNPNPPKRDTHAKSNTKNTTNNKTNTKMLDQHGPNNTEHRKHTKTPKTPHDPTNHAQGGCGTETETVPNHQNTTNNTKPTQNQANISRNNKKPGRTLTDHPPPKPPRNSTTTQRPRADTPAIERTKKTIDTSESTKLHSKQTWFRVWHHVFLFICNTFFFCLAPRFHPRKLKKLEKCRNFNFLISSQEIKNKLNLISV